MGSVPIGLGKNKEIVISLGVEQEKTNVFSTDFRIFNL